MMTKGQARAWAMLMSRPQWEISKALRRVEMAMKANDYDAVRAAFADVDHWKAVDRASDMAMESEG